LAVADFWMGLSLGEPGESSALCVVGRREEWQRDPTQDAALQALSWGRPVTIVEVRNLERLPGNLTNPELAGRLGWYLRQSPLRDVIQLVVDDPPRPTLDYLRSNLDAWAYAVRPTTGDKVTDSDDYVENVPIRVLIDNLKAAFDAEQLRIVGNLDLKPELENQIMKLSAAEKWRTDDDDLASALMLACWYGRPRYSKPSIGRESFDAFGF
jgi:hypothetical protein